MNMDPNNLEATGMPSNMKHLHDQQKVETFEKLKNSFDCYGKYSQLNTESEKQEHESDPEISSYEAVNLTEREVKCLNYDYVSSSDCITTDANNSKQPCSAVSTSRSSTVEVGIYKKEGGAEGTSGDMLCNKVVPSSTCQNRFAGNESSNDGETSACFIGGIESVQQICINGGIKLDTGRRLKKELNELDVGRRKGNMLNADADVSKSIVQATFHDKQPKTESSSSNSSHVFLPASSNDSCQETSLDVKSCKQGKSSGTNSYCTPFKCSLEEPTGKTMVSGTKAQVASREVLDSYLLRKQGNMGRASETVGSVSGRGDKKVLGMIADLMKQRIDVPDSSLLKMKNEDLTREGKLEQLPCEVDDGLEVASGVAREAEPEVSTYREASGSSFSTEEKTGDIVNLNSINSSYSAKIDNLMETGPRSMSYNIQGKPEDICSVKMVGEDPELSMKNQQMCIELKEQSQYRGVGTCPTDDGLCGQGFSLPTIPKDLVGSGFDLNEGILGDEVEYPKQLVNETSLFCHVSAPIPVVAKSRIPLCLPLPPLQFEGQISWKGSAATSAFRPASVFYTPYKRKAPSNSDDNHSSRHSQGLKGFDLNVAAEEPSLEVSPKQIERPNFDLNCLSEDNCEPSPLASLPRNCIRDIDLNHNQWFDSTCEDRQDSGQGSQLLRGSAMHPAVSCTGNVRQPGARGMQLAQPVYRPDLITNPGFSHGPAQTFLVAAPRLFSGMENMRTILPSHPNMSYTPLSAQSLAHPFPYNKGFYFDPTNPLTTICHPGVVPCMTDPHGTAVIPHAFVSSTPPAFPMTPHLMNAAGGPSPCDIAIIRPSLDLNGGVSARPEYGSRGGIATRLFVPVGNSLLQEQMKSFQQFALPATHMKRREPDDGGWDSHQLGYRQ